MKGMTGIFNFLCLISNEIPNKYSGARVYVTNTTEKFRKKKQRNQDVINYKHRLFDM